MRKTVLQQKFQLVRGLLPDSTSQRCLRYTKFTPAKDLEEWQVFFLYQVMVTVTI